MPDPVTLLVAALSGGASAVKIYEAITQNLKEDKTTAWVGKINALFDSPLARIVKWDGKDLNSATVTKVNFRYAVGHQWEPVTRLRELQDKRLVIDGCYSYLLRDDLAIVSDALPPLFDLLLEWPEVVEEWTTAWNKITRKEFRKRRLAIRHFFSLIFKGHRSFLEEVMPAEDFKRIAISGENLKGCYSEVRPWFREDKYVIAAALQPNIDTVEGKLVTDHHEVIFEFIHSIVQKDPTEIQPNSVIGSPKEVVVLTSESPKKVVVLSGEERQPTANQRGQGRDADHS
jgi:hypothetical protein